MEELITGVDFLAVLVGAVVSFLLGWLWFSPKLFGVKWAEGVGVSLAAPQKMPMGAMGSQIVGLLLMSRFVGVTAVSSALLTVRSRLSGTNRLSSTGGVGSLLRMPSKTAA